MRRNRRGFITVIEVMILLVVVAIFASIAEANRSRFRHRPSPKRACTSTMKTIDGAVELYLMEKNLRDGTRIDLATLEAEGYLKVTPTCPANGVYTVRVNAASGATAGATDIRCSVHGTIDDTTSGL